MAYVATRPFEADGVQYEPGDPVNEGALRGNSAAYLTSGGYIVFVPDELMPIEGLPPATEAAETTAAQEGVKLDEVEPSGAQGQVTQDDVKEAAQEQEEHQEQVADDVESAEDPTDDRVDATDDAIALAEEEGVILTAVQGSGKNGRIVLGDVRKYIKENESRSSGEE